MGITKENLKNILTGFYDKIKPELNHSNMNVLNKIGENEEGEILFNGEKVKGSGGSVDLSKYMTTEAATNSFVSKVGGQGLSKNDFTDAYKKKLDLIEEGANYFDPSSLKRTNISVFATDANHLTVTREEKTSWNDKYTKSEIDNKIAQVEAGREWLPAVADYQTLLETYPEPTKNQCCTTDEGVTYAYNGSEWIKESSINIPLATEELAGKMSSDDKTKLDGIEEGANNFKSSDINVDEVEDGEEKLFMTKSERSKLSGMEDYVSNELNKYRKNSEKIGLSDMDTDLVNNLTSGANVIDDEDSASNKVYSSSHVDDLFASLNAQSESTRVTKEEMDSWFN